MCLICIELDRSTMNFEEGSRALGEMRVKLDPQHIVEVEKKLDEAEEAALRPDRMRIGARQGTPAARRCRTRPMQKCARSAVIAASLLAGAGWFAPSAARADEPSDKAEVLTAEYRRSCGGSGPANRVIPDHTVCEELAFNTARAFAGAGDLSKAITMYRNVVMLDERAHGHSALGATAAREIGGAYQTLFLYDLAAEWHERYAAAYPKAADAEAALSDAVILRLALSQEQQALRDAWQLVKLYGASRPAMAAQLMLAIALHHGEKEDWEQARSVARSSMALFDRAPIDIQLQAHALLARALAHGRTPAAAKDEYAKTRALWKDPRAAEAALRAARPAETVSQADRRLARSLNAVGEAMFAAADDQRVSEVEPLKFPVFVGPADTAAVAAHLSTKVRPWFEKKKAAIERAEKAFVQILELSPLPPPKWVIATSATVGAMWSGLADDFRRVPVPAAWRKNGELLRAYSEGIDEMSESIRARYAKPAMTRCIDLSVKYQFQDERTPSCARWLASNYKTEFHLVDEIIPSFRASDAPAESAPHSYEGRPLHY